MQCTFIKPNGHQCQGKALWGSDPPRCAAHRQDEGPTPPGFQKKNQFARLNATHGFYRRRDNSRAKTIEEETAEVLLIHEHLSTLIQAETDRVKLLNLYTLYAQNLGHLLALLQRYRDTTGQTPNDLLALANAAPKEKLKAELASLPQTLKATIKPTYPQTPKRSPRYWLIYNFIANYIKNYWVGPTWREIKKACHITSNHVLEYWLNHLEQDGLIIRQPGLPRGIGLPDNQKPEE